MHPPVKCEHGLEESKRHSNKGVTDDSLLTENITENQANLNKLSKRHTKWGFIQGVLL